MFGADLFKSLFEKFKNRPILVYGDPDSDGLISLKLMCDFCDMFGLKYKYFVNEHRHHGFTLSPSVLNGYLVYLYMYLGIYLYLSFFLVEQLERVVLHYKNVYRILIF